MYKIILRMGLVLLILGAFPLISSLWNGPISWHTDDITFWGVPISLFVLWIGLAHAGTLISAIFLALGFPLDRRTSMVAELSTLCSLVVAGIFPLLHLGVIQNFYMVIPFLDSRGNFSNMGSPLVWDFCAISIYGITSTLFFLSHLLSEKYLKFKEILHPMACLMFPLVLWVHTIVSLDFASTFLSFWRGAYFPLYFIAGAIYSGLALVIILLSTEHCRVRILEKLLLSLSWIMTTFWFWEFLIKGEFSFVVVLLGAVVPQFLWFSSVRENTFGRIFVSFSIITSLLLERYHLVMPTNDNVENGISFIDVGLILFSVGLFIVLFFIIRKKIGAVLEGNNVVMGEIPLFIDKILPKDILNSIRKLRLPLLLGILITLIFVLWSISVKPYSIWDYTPANIIPLCLPLIILVAFITLCVKPFYEILPHKIKLISILCFLFVGTFLGMFYGGGSSSSSGTMVTSENDFRDISRNEKQLWDSKCAVCHGSDGNFNEKFVREFYPIPQKLTIERIDSLGEDSLANVILHGRRNMSAYEGRISMEEVNKIVSYMKFLAGENK